MKAEQGAWFKWPGRGGQGRHAQPGRVGRIRKVSETDVYVSFRNASGTWSQRIITRNRFEQHAQPHQEPSAEEPSAEEPSAEEPSAETYRRDRCANHDGRLTSTPHFLWAGHVPLCVECTGAFVSWMLDDGWRADPELWRWALEDDDTLAQLIDAAAK